MTIKDIIKNIKVNEQESYFTLLIQGLLKNLNEITEVPHIILNTGDDEIWRRSLGYDFSEEMEGSSSDQIYMKIPRCIVTVGGVNVLTDQLSSPYSRGKLQLETDEDILELVAEMRRMPFTIDISLKYYVSTYNEILKLMQKLLGELVFIKSFNFIYLGQVINASYKIGESFEGQYNAEFDGESSDSKTRTMEISVELESYLPIYDQDTLMLNNPGIETKNINVHA